MTSLRAVEKTDFFTKEVDQLLIEKKADIAIHSAKDLADTLDDNLQIIALTKSVNSDDVLLLKKGLKPNALTEKHVIATSSLQREMRTKKIAPHVSFTAALHW